MKSVYVKLCLITVLATLSPLGQHWQREVIAPLWIRNHLGDFGFIFMGMLMFSIFTPSCGFTISHCWRIGLWFTAGGCIAYEILQGLSESHRLIQILMSINIWGWKVHGLGDVSRFSWGDIYAYAIAIVLGELIIQFPFRFRKK